MKLRFRKNTLRFRVNQQEVRDLALGHTLREQVHFPGTARFGYSLTPAEAQEAWASFEDGVIEVGAPQEQVEQWAATAAVGIYFDLPAGTDHLLRVSIEKDLECLDEPASERDPHAFPRSDEQTC